MRVDGGDTMPIVAKALAYVERYEAASPALRKHYEQVMPGRYASTLEGLKRAGVHRPSTQMEAAE